MTEQSGSALYENFKAAVRERPGAAPKEFVAGSRYRLPARDHILPPFQSVYADRWDMDPEHREAMVQEELRAYNADMQGRMRADPVALFGVPFRRSDQLAAAARTQLHLVMGNGDVLPVDFTDTRTL